LSELSAKPRTAATYRNIQPQGRNFLDNSEKTPAGQLQTFDGRISQTTWSFEMKLWGDDEHPKERILKEQMATREGGSE
jgi:hypothetical protein